MSEEETVPYAPLLSTGALGPLAKKADNVADILMSDKHLKKVTEIKVVEGEDIDYALVIDIFKTIDSLANRDNLVGYQEIPMIEIPENIFRLRISNERKGVLSLTDVGKVHIQTESVKPERSGLLGWLRGRRK